MVANANGIQDYDEFLNDFKKRCYPSALILDDETDGGEYLECKIKVASQGKQLVIYHWNKNHSCMASQGSQYYYKHQHFHSYTTNHSKRGALIGTWTRMQDNTMNNSDLNKCVREKLVELNSLSYPFGYIHDTLVYMHKKTGNDAWLI